MRRDIVSTARLVFLFVNLLASSLSHAQDIASEDQPLASAGEVLKLPGLVGMQHMDLWANISSNPPKFGVVARDQEGRPLDVFDLDGAAPSGMNAITVPGFKLPAGGTFERVGPVGWAVATGDLRATLQKETGFGLNIEDAAIKINRVAATIRQQLCKNPGRPTEVVLTFDASFEFVVAAGAGTQLRWDMEVVCSR